MTRGPTIQAQQRAATLTTRPSTIHARAGT